MSALASGLAEILSGSFLQEFSLFLLSNLPGFPPIIQTVHILGIAVVMGSIVILDLRILGLAVPSQSLSEMTGRLLPWFWWALLSNVVSGSVFVFARPNRYFDNPVFGWKMTFLLLAVLLTLAFHYLSRRQPDFWTSTRQRLWTARGIALLSLGLWVMIMTAGRWIAYLEYIEYPLWSFEVFDAGPQPSFLLAVDNWPLSQIIAATNWFPTLETIHVIAITGVVGSILWVDLRLLGLAARRYPITTLSRELLPWTWGAFVVATVTGLGMLITRASSHVDNPAVQWKFFLLLLAGINMAVFHLKVFRQIDNWDNVAVPPGKVRFFGASSLLLWSGVTLAGRWIGHIV